MYTYAFHRVYMKNVLNNNVRTNFVCKFLLNVSELGSILLLKASTSVRVLYDMALSTALVRWPMDFVPQVPCTNDVV